MKKLLESVHSIQRVSFDKQIEDIEVRQLAQKWSSALKQKNIRELLDLSATLGGGAEVSQKLFRNLAYEISMAQRVESQITEVYRAGKWVAVGFSHGEGDEIFFSLMLTVATDEGLKVLPEIDLISDRNRTRKFLNKVSLERL